MGCGRRRVPLGRALASSGVKGVILLRRWRCSHSASSLFTMCRCDPSSVGLYTRPLQAAATTVQGKVRRHRPCLPGGRPRGAEYKVVANRLFQNIIRKLYLSPNLPSQQRSGSAATFSVPKIKMLTFFKGDDI